MPTAHPKATYGFCLPRVVKFLGVADPSYPDGTVVAANAPYTLAQIKAQLCQSDVEICSMIASVIEHPFRNEYFTETPSTINSGARIPAYIGVHGGVEVYLGSTWYPGKLAQSLAHLQRVAEKYAIAPALIPASSQRLYWIENGKLYLAVAATGRVYTPTIPIANPADTTPTFSTPQSHQWAVIGHAIMTLRPVGADETHRNSWEKIFAGYAQMILSGSASLPEPERFERIAG